MNPFDYFRLRYYEKWLGGISAYLVENGYLSQAELDAATARYREHPQQALPERADDAVDEQVIGYLRQGDSPRRGPATAGFAVGDRVRVGNPPPGAHTRLPGYLRGRAGRIERAFEGNYRYACSTGPDGLGEPMPVYLVRFEPREIWGEMAEAGAGALYAELYQAYLSRIAPAAAAGEDGSR